MKYDYRAGAPISQVVFDSRLNLGKWGRKIWANPKPEIIVIIRDRVRMRESTSSHTPSRLHSLLPYFLSARGGGGGGGDDIIGRIESQRASEVTSSRRHKSLHSRLKRSIFRHLNCLLNIAMSTKIVQLLMHFNTSGVIGMQQELEGPGRHDSVKQAN